MEPTLQRSILDLRAGMDDTESSAFEADLRSALSLPPDQHERALGLVVRSWTSRRELADAPDVPSWLR
jgi:hypothetical protein